MNIRAKTVPSAKPIPADKPIPAQAHNPAAVVRPFTSFRPVIMIVPTPRNPIPLMTCAPIRVISVLEPGNSRKTYSLTIMDIAAPRQTNACVFIPAPLFLYPLSNPIITPTAVANNKRKNIPATLHSLIKLIIDSNINTFPYGVQIIYISNHNKSKY